MLNNTRITHLLWADDLVLLSLTPEGLQKQLDVLYDYCLDWGLTVNISKTAVLVFNRQGRKLKESNHFMFGNMNIPSQREYCYLGIVFSLSGSLRRATEVLKQKGFRSYFALKAAIKLSSLKPSITMKLFDMLVKPAASYGCQIWLPMSSAFKVDKLTTDSSTRILRDLANDPLEKLHISFLKWTKTLFLLGS